MLLVLFVFMSYLATTATNITIVQPRIYWVVVCQLLMMSPPMLHCWMATSTGAPYIALLMQASWAIVLILLPGSSFSTLLDYAGAVRCGVLECVCERDCAQCLHAYMHVYRVCAVLCNGCNVLCVTAVVCY